MYYVETRADNSGYANHRLTCLVVMGSPFDSEQETTPPSILFELFPLFDLE
jgi:hypothetical protein